jgi:hypothetical protein
MDGLAQADGRSGAVHRETGEMVVGDSYVTECRYSDDGSVDRDFFFYDGAGGAAPAAPQIDIQTIVQQVYAEVPLALPVPHTSPPADADQLAGFPVWMWVDADVWRSFEAEASVAGVTVSVEAQPAGLEWDMGDGTVVSCTGPGSSEDSGDCSHIYQHVGDYEAEVRITWSISWQASTGESGTLPAASRAAPFELTVVERQAVVDYG